MAIKSQLLIDEMASKLLALGRFERVNQHEFKAAPNRGLSAAVWIDEIEPIRHSGLDATSVRVAFNARIYTDMLTKPEDMIDPRIMEAADEFFASLTGDFTLGGEVRMIDALGAYGKPLQGQSGYINIDNKVYRVFTMTIPIVINDGWSQSS